MGVIGGLEVDCRWGGRVERTELRVQGWARGAAVVVAERGSLVGGWLVLELEGVELVCGVDIVVKEIFLIYRIVVIFCCEC